MKLLESKVDPDTKKAIYETNGKFYYCAGFVQDTIVPKTLTFCISTQVGCPEKCKFCATGDYNLVRNLTAEEIAQEITDGVNYMQNSVVNNNLDIVRLGFEGMGEFSHNAKNGFEAVRLVYPYLSSKFKQIIVRPTSVGNIRLVDKYKDFITQNQYMLDNTIFQAKLSVHTPFQEERVYLSPVTSGLYDIETILSKFYELSDFLGQKLRCNYVLFDYPNGGNNYSEKHMEKLSKILVPEKTKLLLQQYSETGKQFKSPNIDVFYKWLEHFNKIGIETGMTKMKGYDIDAACGMMHYNNKTKVR